MIRRPPLAWAGVVAVLVLVVAVGLALSFRGAFGTHPPPPEGAHDVAPVESLGPKTLKTGVVAATRLAGGAEERHEWTVANATYRDGVFTVPAEGVTLRWRIDVAPPVRLRHDAALERQNTFAFDVPGGAGNVSADSRLDALTWDYVDGRVSARFHLVYDGPSGAVVLDGEFPKPRPTVPAWGAVGALLALSAAALATGPGRRGDR